MAERAGVTETQEGSEERLPPGERVLEARLCQGAFPLQGRGCAVTCGPRQNRNLMDLCLEQEEGF